MTLLELAERCEQAAGPDRHIDAVLNALLNGATHPQGPPACFFAPPSPYYTGSIDKAVTLVPKGWVEGYTRPFDDLVAAACSSPDGAAFYGHAATPALALCTAALRARASQDTQP